MSSAGVTVVIPTYNGARRVEAPLQALLAQQAPSACFEVVVVDNNSADGTARVVEDSPAVAGLRRRGVDVRVVHEARQGLLFARLCGIQRARREVICFLDDDNIPEPNFLADGLAHFEDAAVGVVVSRIYPRYETPPPPSISRREHLLAINHRMGDDLVDFGAGATLAPTIGAGLWLRRAAVLEAVPWRTPEQLMPDRLGNQLLSGGDIELGFLLGKAGHRRLYAPALKVWHVIPRSRFETRYFFRLIVGVVRSEQTLQARYLGRRSGGMARWKAFARLLGAGLASPVLAFRGDSVREILFVLASRWAQVQGPYPQLHETR
ncbi:glycosyltransferase [Myxococcus llanfairpwllgwyngyllgogerychwyrndrobwllllantysiliogogogochensis]|uniref:Glycosyltransferase n=1 Tax=Myxococcus llanfairpwllgwyngyllgogerychwyrndrobwllllantysiliogogogochensis TaxID=2590453 RepID=A0A540WUN5_9BACT|nr:glycosyltransferase [Myxococcus llanfairpwllgwyngyllgogerychwyrndrobwllllantysiliogogogochensis]TQF12713.1 glycosyltransferase [Myxococcus llanfairpwllgwyngyllgogerychwyrndrobwllllantysiliogogogochensis]